MNKKEFLFKAVSSPNISLDTAIKLMQKTNQFRILQEGISIDSVIGRIVLRPDCPLDMALDFVDSEGSPISSEVNYSLFRRPDWMSIPIEKFLEFVKNKKMGNTEVMKICEHPDIYKIDFESLMNLLEGLQWTVKLKTIVSSHPEVKEFSSKKIIQLGKKLKWDYRFVEVVIDRPDLSFEQAIDMAEKAGWPYNVLEKISEKFSL